MSGLTRERQREIGALAETCRRVPVGDSTLPATIHAEADLMEWLSTQEVELFRDFTPAQRRRLAKEGRAMPDGSFPIVNCTDARNAIRAQGRAAPEKRGRVRAFIRRRVRALGCTGRIFDDYR
jgi:hypothetical protein